MSKSLPQVQPDLTPATKAPYAWWQSADFELPFMRDHLFNYFWTLPTEYVEEPNQRRGGWGAVTVCVLPSGEKVYVKRQQNHFFRDPLRMGRRGPTLRREWRMLTRMAKDQVSAPLPLVYGERRLHGNIQAILVTRELTNFEPLEDVLSRQPANAPQRAIIAAAAAALLRKLHTCGYVHKSMTGKHLLVRDCGNGTWDACTLDLEKARRALLRTRAGFRDLKKLFTSTASLTREDRAQLLQAYCCEWPPRKSELLRKRLQL